MATVSTTTQTHLMHLGQRLRNIRLTRNLSLSAFAGQLDVSAATLRRMECGNPGVSIGRWAIVLRQLGGSDALEGLLRNQGPRTAYLHQRHPRGLRQRTV